MREDPRPDRLADATPPPESLRRDVTLPEVPKCPESQPAARAASPAPRERSCWTCRHDYIADGIGGHGCRALTCDEAADAPIVTYCDASGAPEARALAAMHAAIADDEREQGWRGLLEEDVTGAPYSDVRPWLR